MWRLVIGYRYEYRHIHRQSFLYLYIELYLYLRTGILLQQAEQLNQSADATHNLSNAARRKR